jgi:hypothetical protein
MELPANFDVDLIHLDMTLGATPVEELSSIHFSGLRISGEAKNNLLKLLPKLKKIAVDIRQKHGIEVLAIGKESVP